jgi:hypothetical protein
MLPARAIQFPHLESRSIAKVRSIVAIVLSVKYAWKPQRKSDLSADDAEGRRCKGGSCGIDQIDRKEIHAQQAHRMLGRSPEGNAVRGFYTTIRSSGPQRIIARRGWFSVFLFAPSSRSRSFELLLKATFKLVQVFPRDGSVPGFWKQLCAAVNPACDRFALRRLGRRCEFHV